jgi:hypothetical protein
MVLYATWGLVKSMLEAVRCRGDAIISENRYFDLIQDSVGRDSMDPRFRTAWGLVLIPQLSSRIDVILS